MKVTARANANIAFIKYWGKRDTRLNIPAVGSISLTLKGLSTSTSVEFRREYNSDRFILNGAPAPVQELQRVSRFLDLIRKKKELNRFARVESKNNFPTAAGLASSASGFAALARAATLAAGWEADDRELSILARQGSGSAARSVFGGFVEMHRGSLADGSDSFAEIVADENYWDLRLLVAVTSEQTKRIASTEGMNRTARTSSYYASWVEYSEKDLAEMRQAILQKDFHQVGELCEYSALKMHALALSARPGILYWNRVTVDLIHQIRQWRRENIPVYFTIDAGPQVKVLCQPGFEQKIHNLLSAYPGVQNVILTGPGRGVRLVENS